MAAVIKTENSRELPGSDYRALENFRYQIRSFLHFSEQAALAEGLEPQQHQFLLAIRAAGPPVPGYAGAPTIGMLADRLFIRHHSAVGLADRLERRGLVERLRGGEDLRQVRLRLTRRGAGKLKRLSRSHREELSTSGPVLVETLRALLEGCGAGCREGCPD